MSRTALRRPALALLCLRATVALGQSASPSPSAPASPTDPPSEYRVKALYLYNLARFVEWPAEARREAEAPFVIVVLGRDPFGSVLDDTMAGKAIENRRIEVRRLGRVEDAGDAQIVFVSASERRDLPAILKALDRPGVLTVGEWDGFAEQGGMVTFLVQEGRVRFEINPRRAEEAGLKVSSQLLKLATIVPGPPS
jgi:uncharacterized protein DUF4154